MDNMGRNVEELFGKTQACRFVYAHGEQICPVNWTPGAGRLRPGLDLMDQL